MPAEARVPAEMSLERWWWLRHSPGSHGGVTDTVFRRFIRTPACFRLRREHESQVTESDQGAHCECGEHGRSSIDAAVTTRNPAVAADDRVHSADGLARMRRDKRRRYLTFYDDEHPIGAQIFGAIPAHWRGARIVEETASIW